MVHILCVKCTIRILLYLAGIVSVNPGNSSPGVVRKIWKKYSKVYHSSESGDTRTQQVSHHYPTQPFLRLSPTLHCLAHHLPCKHLHHVLQCAWISAMQQFYLPSSSASAGQRHFYCTSASTPPQESTHILPVFVSRKIIICRLQSLVLNKGWFLQSSCILCLQQKSFVPNVGISPVISLTCY